MERPPELFDRDREWSDLVEFTLQRGAGTSLALVYGRRRQGKSFLLRRLVVAAGGFYYQALEEERSQALAGFGAALGAHLNVPGGRLAFGDWEEAFGAVTKLRHPDRPALVVLDEFPYLLAHSPELASVLQRAIDHSRDGGAPVRLVLCGSALSVMARLLTGNQALRGRASHEVTVGMFDYRTAADFWGISSPAAAFLVHAVLGGTLGYRDLLPAKPPGGERDFGRWLTQGVLNPASALFREDDYLLTEERSLADRALYQAVIASIARGNTTQATIAAALGREQRAVQYPLRALEGAGFVSRSDDVLRSRRPIYRLADPIIRFHHVVTRQDLARFEDRRTAEAWSDALPRFGTHVLGPHFEQIAREFTFRFAGRDTVGGVAATVGAAVINDAKARVQHELDIVVLGRDRRGSTPILAIGEAKHTSRRRTIADLDRLERIRGLIGAANAKLLLFSASGFDRNLVKLADDRPEVELIDLNRIYLGS